MASFGTCTVEKKAGGSPIPGVFIAGMDYAEITFTDVKFYARSGYNTYGSLFQVLSTSNTGGIVIASAARDQTSVQPGDSNVSILSQSYSNTTYQITFNVKCLRPATPNGTGGWKEAPLSAGANNYYFYFKDNNSSFYQTVSIQAYTYTWPSITTTEAVRCDSNGTANEQGKYIKVRANWTYADIGGTNVVTAKFTWAQSGQTMSSPITLTKDVWSTPQGGNILPQKSYDVEFRVDDLMGGYAESTKSIAMVPAPVVPSGNYWGFMSDLKSGADTRFETPIELLISFYQPSTLNGISFLFNAYDNSWCDDMSIQYIYENSSSTIEELHPDRVDYYLNTVKTGAIAVKMTFKGMCKKDRFLWIQKLVFGRSYVFGSDTIVSHRALLEMNPLGADLPKGSLDFDLLLAGQEVAPFNRRRAIRSYCAEKLIGTFFMDDADKMSMYRWRIRCFDVVETLERAPFDGDLYEDSHVFYNDPVYPQYYGEGIIKDLQVASKVKIELDSAFYGEKVSGWIPFTTCRNALVQVAFALGAIIEIGNDGIVHVRKISTSVTSHISADRCKQGVQVKKNDYAVKSVTVSSWSYIAKAEVVGGEELIAIEKVADIVPSTTPKRIYVSQPRTLWQYGAIGSSGIGSITVTKTSANFWEYKTTANLSSNWKLSACTRLESEVLHTWNNPNVAEDEEVVSIDYKKYKLINEANAQQALDLAVAMALRNETVFATVILENEKVGDMVTIETDNGIKTGNITKMDIDINNRQIAGLEIKA